MPTYEAVTVVMPSLNQGKYIREAIDSVLAQDYPNIQLLVKDGGSTDGTLEILKSYGGRIIWTFGADGGQAEAINAGVEAASSVYVSWLNSDDTLLPGAITLMVALMEARLDIDVVYGNTLFTGPDGTPMFQSDLKPFNFNDFVIECKNPIAQPSTLIRRSAWVPLDTNLKYFFDWNLWLRIGRDWNMLYTPYLLSTYRLHDESKTTGKVPAEELQYIYMKLFADYSLEWLSSEAFGNMFKRKAEYHRNNGEKTKAIMCEVKAWLSK